MIPDIDKVLGAVPFASNVRLPGMQWCALVRSSEPHALIRHIDVDRARQMPGVRAVVCGDDLVRDGRMAVSFGPVLHDQPVLAVGKVRYVGEPVVAVVAATPEAAREAASAVVVDYDPLPAVYTVDDALADGAPRLFDADPAIDASFADVSVHSDFARNVVSTFRIVRGDAARALEEAAHVFEHRFSTPAAQHVPLETHACVASWGGDRLTVHSGTQSPFILRAQLAGMFSLPLGNVRVVAPPLGGGFGSKVYANIEPLVAALALLVGRPVKLHLGRDEEFVTVTKHAMQVTLRTGVDREGRLVARHAVGYFNSGAYANISPRKIVFGAYGINGPYRVPDVRHEMAAVCTNTPPAGAYRGYAINQCAWAYESQMDIIAAELGIDPLELRLRNLLQPGDTFCTGETMGDVHFSELLRRAAAAIGYDGARSRAVTGDRVRGVGLSCIIEGTITPTTSTAVAKLNADGSLTLVTGSVEMGQGIQHALCRVGAEALGIDIDAVSVAEVDTDSTPYDQQTTASRSTFSMGAAVDLACDEVRRQLADAGAGLLGGPVTVRAGRVVSDADPLQSLTYAEVVARARLGNLIGRGTYRTEGGLDPEDGQGIASVHWHQSAAAAEVEVDRRTGQVRVLAYRGAVHAGRIVDPVGAALQCEGGLTFGVGNTFHEQLVFDRGQLVNGTLADYMVPALTDMPDAYGFEILEETDGPPLGADSPVPPRRTEVHGLGEPLLPPVAPAIGNALAHATGVRIHDLPLSAEAVLRSLAALPCGTATEAVAVAGGVPGR